LVAITIVARESRDPLPMKQIRAAQKLSPIQAVIALEKRPAYSKRFSARANR